MTAHIHVSVGLLLTMPGYQTNSDLGALVATPRCDDGDAKNAGLNNDVLNTP